MALRSDWSQRTCGLARGLDLLGDPWNLLVLGEVFCGNRRFDAIKSRIAVSDSVLSKRLADLTRVGLLAKQNYDNDGRTRQEYVLTPKGEDTLPVLNAVIIWAEKHLPAPTDGAHTYVIHSGCGQPTNSPDTCMVCKERLTTRNTSWHSLADNAQPIRLFAAPASHGS